MNVPDVLGTGHAALVIGDNGSSFNTCLRQADEAGRDRLVMAAMQAIAEAHARGAYFGQPLPRNLTWDGDKVGFIDFEEDPLEVMDLSEAQARDWLMFGYGVAKYYADRPEHLQAMMAEAMGGAQAPVREHVHAVSGRLRSGRVCMKLGRSARAGPFDLHHPRCQHCWRADAGGPVRGFPRRRRSGRPAAVLLIVGRGQIPFPVERDLTLSLLHTPAYAHVQTTQRIPLIMARFDCNKRMTA